MRRIVLATAVLLTACAPSERQASDYLGTQCWWKNATKCATRFVSFEKDDGIEHDLMGLKAYTMTGTVRYVFEEDAIERTYLGERRVAAPQLYEQVYKTEVVVAKGTKREAKVDVVFVRTEKGWQVQGGTL